MRILALSDEVVERLYGPDVKQVVGNVDLVLGCGDVPHYYLEFVVTMLGVPLYYVPGNHDRMEQVLADGRTVTEPQGCVNLDHHLAREHDLLLAGLGGSIRYKPTGLHQYTEAEMSWRAWQMAPALWWNRVTHGRDLDILVTHSPPFGIHDASDPAHVGFKAFLRFMRLHRPRYLIHGHSHVYRRDVVTQTQFEGTRVINIYPYRILEWESTDHAPRL